MLQNLVLNDWLVRCEYKHILWVLCMHGQSTSMDVWRYLERYYQYSSVQFAPFSILLCGVLVDTSYVVTEVCMGKVYYTLSIDAFEQWSDIYVS